MPCIAPALHIPSKYTICCAVTLSSNPRPYIAHLVEVHILLPDPQGIRMDIIDCLVLRRHPLVIAAYTKCPPESFPAAETTEYHLLQDLGLKV